MILAGTMRTCIKAALDCLKSTPLFMLYAELGRYPIEIIIKSRMVSFWILAGKQEKLSYNLYQAIRYIIPQRSKWLSFVKQIILDVGRHDLWLNQNNIGSTKIGKLVRRTLIDQNLQTWHRSAAYPLVFSFES